MYVLLVGRGDRSRDDAGYRSDRAVQDHARDAGVPDTPQQRGHGDHHAGEAQQAGRGMMEALRFGLYVYRRIRHDVQ